MNPIPQTLQTTERFPPKGGYQLNPRSNFLNPCRKKIVICSIAALILILIIAIVIIIINKNNHKNEKPIKEGYFYPTDDPDNLHKCNVPQCSECIGTILDNICAKCFKGTFPQKSSNKIVDCLKNICDLGEGEKCASCGNNFDECASCNQGYILSPETKKCQTCIIKYCENCPNGNTCTKCEDYATPDDESKITKCLLKKGEESLCKELDSQANKCTSCNYGYKLEDGKCTSDFDFKAVFETRTNNETVKLIDKFYPYVKEMTLDEIKLNNITKTYTFPEKGKHNVLYKINIPKDESLIGLFEGLSKMTSIYFSKSFDIESIKNIDRMFYNCQKLKNIDLSNLNTENTVNLNNMFYQCLNLKSINMSAIKTSKVEDASNMFENCIILNNIDISSFSNVNIQTNDIFKGVPSSGNIIVNENFEDKIKSFLPGWNVIKK